MAAVLIASMAVPAGAADPKSAQSQLNKAAAEYARVQSEIGRLEARTAKLESDLAAADGIIRQRSAAMGLRAGYLYRSGGVGTYLEGLLTAPDLGVFLKRLQLIGALQDTDAKLIDSIRVTKSRATEIREELERAQARQRRLLKDLRDKQRALESRLRAAKSASRVSRYGRFSGFVVPILGPVAFSDSWGDRRSGGRRHQGTDLMASCGARVVAVTDGVIQNLHSGGLGGIMLYLRAANGDVFFYAHLRGYASGVSTGKRVAAGDHIAYNGNSGNARGGPCHVHFEWHPRGGRPANPYSLLRSALG